MDMGKILMTLLKSTDHTIW